MMEEQKITIVYKKSSDFRIYPAQVIYGGPTPDGSGIVMNFGVDHLPIPNYTQHKILEGKVDVSVDQAAQVGNMERELLGALYITIKQAKATADWLNSQIKLIEDGRHES